MPFSFVDLLRNPMLRMSTAALLVAVAAAARADAAPPDLVQGLDCARGELTATGHGRADACDTDAIRDGDADLCAACDEDLHAPLNAGFAQSQSGRRSGQSGAVATRTLQPEFQLLSY